MATRIEIAIGFILAALGGFGLLSGNLGLSLLLVIGVALLLFEGGRWIGGKGNSQPIGRVEMEPNEIVRTTRDDKYLLITNDGQAGTFEAQAEVLWCSVLESLFSRQYSLPWDAESANTVTIAQGATKLLMISRCSAKIATVVTKERPDANTVVGQNCSLYLWRHPADPLHLWYIGGYTESFETGHKSILPEVLLEVKLTAIPSIRGGPIRKYFQVSACGEFIEVSKRKAMAVKKREKKKWSLSN